MPLLADEPSLQLEGRDAELAALATAFDDACAGHGRIAVVSGEAGIGKSTLVASLAERARQRGVPAVWGRAWEFADAPAYFPLWPCLAAHSAPGSSFGAPRSRRSRLRLRQLPARGPAVRHLPKPADFMPEAGFWDGASARVGAMLLGRDVGRPPVAPLRHLPEGSFTAANEG